MSLDPKAKDADPFDEVGLHLNMGHPFISSFVENSAAQRDGIKIGDHIYRVGNVPVKMPKDFVSEIKKLSRETRHITRRRRKRSDTYSGSYTGSRYGRTG